jgi:two-component system nitrogen regulation sensor histidine kinase GlnL
MPGTRCDLDTPVTEPSANPFGGLDLLSSAVLLLDETLAIRYHQSGSRKPARDQPTVFAGCRLDSVIECPPKLLAALDSAFASRLELHRTEYLSYDVAGGDDPQLNCTVNPVESPTGTAARRTVADRPATQEPLARSAWSSSNTPAAS